MAQAEPISNAPDHSHERRSQILRAAMVCFARRGFHPTTMQDIGAEAGISVGLIYRYFENKDAVIAYMAREHMEDVRRLLDESRRAPTLFDALTRVFTCHCEAEPDHVHAAFVMDLFAEAARNPHVRALLREVHHFFIDGVAELIAGSAEARGAGPSFAPHAAAEVIVDSAHGLMIRSIADASTLTAAEIKDRRLAMLRRLWPLLFPGAPSPASSGGPSS